MHGVADTNKCVNLQDFRGKSFKYFTKETTPDIAQKEFFSPDISYTLDMSQK